jgi:hypothetical protein
VILKRGERLVTLRADRILSVVTPIAITGRFDAIARAKEESMEETSR